MNGYRSWEAGGREGVGRGMGWPSGDGRKWGEGGAKVERRQGEGRAKEGRTDGEGLRMVWGWKWGRNVVEWKKMCIFAK